MFLDGASALRLFGWIYCIQGIHREFAESTLGEYGGFIVVCRGLIFFGGVWNNSGTSGEKEKTVG